MEIREVRIELDRIREHLRLKAYESGSFDEEEFYENQANVIDEACEYLWQYEELHH